MAMAVGTIKAIDGAQQCNFDLKLAETFQSNDLNTTFLHSHTVHCVKENRHLSLVVSRTTAIKLVHPKVILMTV